MHHQLLLFTLIPFICAIISSTVTHTARPGVGRKTYTHGRTSTTIHTSCSAEHSCAHTEHPATAVKEPEWYTTTVEGRVREVELAAVTGSTRHTTVSEGVDTGGMLLPVHRVAESPGLGVLADSAFHTTSSAGGAVEPIETAGMLLPVHRVAEAPGVGVLAGSVHHTTISATGTVGPIKKGSFLLPVHGVAENPGVVGVKDSIGAGREQW